jgi:hypothetical protein
MISAVLSLAVRARASVAGLTAQRIRPAATAFPNASVPDAETVTEA